MELEHDDEFNDETFGVDTTSLQPDFDFSANAIPVSELEAQMMRTSMLPGVVNVADLEARMMGQSTQSAPSKRDPTLEKAYLDRKAKYDSWMTQSDMDYVSKIQLAQLANDETYEDDFYFRIAKEKRAKSSAVDNAVSIQKALGGEGGISFGTSAEEQEKFHKMLAEAKARARPKTTQRKPIFQLLLKKIVNIAGALGNIPVNSLRNPKQLLQITKQPSLDTGMEPPKSGKGTLQRILASIEKIYQHLVSMDELYRKWTKEQTSWADAATAAEQQLNFNRSYTQLVKKVWIILLNLIPVAAAEHSESDELLKPLPPYPFSILLSFRKGRRLVPRLLAFLPRKQMQLLLQATFHAMATIQLRTQDPVEVLAELDAYTNELVLPFVGVIAECSITDIIFLCQPIIQSSELLRIARVKPGLMFLTLFMSRIQIIKQLPPTATFDADFSNFQNLVLHPTFKALSGRFTALFPPAYILPPIVSGSSTGILKPIPVDDEYVWQFLGSVAALVGQDEQRSLVVEAREKVFEVVSSQGEAGKTKVNLFLNALGLDASQLSQ